MTSHGGTEGEGWVGEMGPDLKRPARAGAEWAHL